jgi:hypothetical protein
LSRLFQCPGPRLSPGWQTATARCIDDDTGPLCMTLLIEDASVDEDFATPSYSGYEEMNR